MGVTAADAASDASAITWLEEENKRMQCVLVKMEQVICLFATFEDQGKHLSERVSVYILTSCIAPL